MRYTFIRCESVEKTLLENSIPEPNCGCLIWIAGKINSEYGLYIDENGEHIPAHRKAYEHWIGSIPSGFEPHHKCEVTFCIEPTHLEALSKSTHKSLHTSRSQTGYCANGHELSVWGFKENRPDSVKGYTLLCRKCKRKAALEYYYRKKERANETKGK